MSSQNTPSGSDGLTEYATCPTSPDGKHWPHWREWREAEREGRPIPCERCGITIWPVCSTCQKPRTNWERHAH